MRKRLDDCMGVRVYYDDALVAIADSRGVWPFKRVLLGPKFNRLTVGEQLAAVTHEVGHCKLFHLEKRIAMAWLVIFSHKRLLRLCWAQEFEADEFARRQGYGAYLVSMFRRMTGECGPWHPPYDERVRRLQGG